MNTLEIAKAITQEDINKANMLIRQFENDKLIEIEMVNNICQKLGLNEVNVSIVFALTYARLEN